MSHADFVCARVEEERRAVARAIVENLVTKAMAVYGVDRAEALRRLIRIVEQNMQKPDPPPAAAMMLDVLREAAL